MSDWSSVITGSGKGLELLRHQAIAWPMMTKTYDAICIQQATMS